MVAYISSVMDEVFKALADASRRKLLDVLHENNGQTLAARCEHLDMTRQAVTKHLNLLEHANLIAVVWHGREKLHYLNPVPIHEIYERWIQKYERPRLQALSDLKKHLENPTPESHGEPEVRLRDAHQHDTGEALERPH
jgi:DNA-binding transcriptional ArsR family regulator